MSEGQTPLDEAFMRDFVALQRKVNDIANAAGAALTTGDIVGNIGLTRPGCLLCDGSTIFDADYPSLGAYIRANFGAAYIISGTQVKVPDAKGRVLASVNASTGYDLGDIFGADTVTLTAAEVATPSHTHTIGGSTGSSSPSTDTQGAHTHTQGSDGNIYNVPSGAFYGLTTIGSTSSAGAHSHTVNSHSHTLPANTGIYSDTAIGHNNIQPTLVVNFFIKT